MSYVLYHNCNVHYADLSGLCVRQRYIFLQADHNEDGKLSKLEFFNFAARPLDRDPICPAMGECRLGTRFQLKMAGFDEETMSSDGIFINFQVFSPSFAEFRAV